MNTNKYYGQGRNTSKVGAMINQNSPQGYKSNQSAWLWVVLFVIAVVLFIAFMLSATPAYAMACDKCDEGGRYNMPVSAEISKDNDTESNTLTVNVPNDTHIIIDDPAIPDDNTDASTEEQVDTGTDNSSDNNQNEDEHSDNGNHYGNDEDDHNDHDQNNPHNGEDTSEDHHNHDNEGHHNH